MDERFRETCERFEQAEIEQNELLHRNAMLSQTNRELTARIAEPEALLENQNNTNAI